MDVTTALFTAANALHNNYATTAEREASRGEQASSSGDGRPDDPEEQKLIDEINSCERMLDDMKKDAEESGSVIKKIMCFLTEVIVDVDGDFMTEAPRARLRLYKLQHDTPKVIRDGLKLLQDYQAGKPLDSNDVHSYLKMLDQWGPHVTGTMAGLAGVRGNLKGRQAFRPYAQSHKPGSAGGYEFKPQSRTVEALGLEGRAGKSTKPVRDMSDREYVQSLADRADKRFEGKGPRVGTDKHTYSQRVHERYQRMTGERPHMEAEKRFLDGDKWQKGQGTSGSSRADMYNRQTNEAYDYKFGDAKLSDRQRQKYEANLPRNSDGTAKVHEVKPGK